MSFPTVLRETFQRLSVLSLSSLADQRELKRCHGCVGSALDLVVEQTYPKIRMLSNYEARLRGPVQEALEFIGGVVDRVPEPVRCSRSTYVQDPRANAFFASPDQIAEVFGQSREVRDLFKSDPLLSECWGLLCMRKVELHRFGVELDGEEVRREVMQTTINFSDHQVVSPGRDEADARLALKCCIFRSLVAHIQHGMLTAKEAQVERDTRIRMLQGRLRSLRDETQRGAIESELEQCANAADKATGFRTLKDYLRFLESHLRDPHDYVSSRMVELRIDRMGIRRMDDGGIPPLRLTEIEVAGNPPRISTLACFPREELPPKVDLLREASIFLAN